MNTQATHASATGSGLPSTGNLIKELFESYKKRGLKLALVFLAMYVGMFVTAIAAGIAIAVAYGLLSFGAASMGPQVASVMRVVLGFVGIVAVLVAIFFVNGVFYSAIFRTSLEDIPFKEAIKFGLKSWKPMAWVVLLVSLVVFGGLVPLVIPGIILGTLIGFGVIVFVDEGKRGFTALLRSRELVKGRWWAVFGRNLLVTLVLYVPIMVLMVFDNNGRSTAVSLITVLYEVFVMVPALLLYHAGLYRHLKALPSRAPAGDATSLYKGLAVWGLVGPLLIAGLSLYAAASFIGSAVSVGGLPNGALLQNEGSLFNSLPSGN